LKRIIAGILILSGVLAAQTTHPAAPKTAKPATSTDASLQKPAAAPAAGMPSKETADSFIRHYFGYNPGLSWKVESITASDVPGLSQVFATVLSGEQRQALKFYVSADGKHAIFGDAVPFGADPFAQEREQLAKKATGPFAGAEKSPVLIVEFSDLQCPHCKVAAPTLNQLISEEPQAKLVFQSFPLPLHDWAQKAAQYGDCVAQKDNAAFWKFVDGVFAAQESISAANADEKLTAIATGAGVDGPATAACAKTPASAEHVKQSFELGRQLDVSGTPTVFVNGRRISSINNLPYDELKAIVEYEFKMANEPAKK